MHPKISAELMLATCRSVEELRGSGGLPSEQADAILAALQYCRSSCSTASDATGGHLQDAPAEHQEGNWDSLPDEIVEQVVKAAQEPTLKQPGDFSCCLLSSPGRITGPWWRARLVSRSWNRCVPQSPGAAAAECCDKLDPLP